MSFTSKWNLITFAPAYPRPSYPFPYFSRSPLGLLYLLSALTLSSPLSSLSLFAGPPCFPIFFDHLLRSSLLSLRYLPSEDASRGLYSWMKIFKFRRLVQRKLLLSPLRPTAAPHPLFVRHSASYPRPNYIHPLPPTYPSALFTAPADIQMPSRLYPSAWA